MQFIHLDILYLLPLVPICALILFIWAGARRSRELAKIVSGTDGSDAVLLSRKKRTARQICITAVLMLLLLVCARPYWSRQLTPELPAGRDVMVLFDVSKSMLSDDVAPSRIEHGKYLLRQLISTPNEDRFGLIAFAGSSYLACPLTSNRTALNEYIDELNCDFIPVGGTNLAGALKRAFTAFKAAEGSHRAILLITDGDELSGDAQKEINELKKQNIPVFIAGIGDPSGVPVRSLDGKVVRGSDGKIAMTRLNSRLLRSIADSTRGYYWHSTATAPGAEQLSKRINELDKVEREGFKRTLPIDKFPQFLIAAFILMVIYILLSERRSISVKKPSNLIIIAVFVLAYPLSAAQTDGKNDEKPHPSTAPELYNRALEEQTKGNDATKLYAETLHLAADSKVIQSKSCYNLAVQSHRGARESISKAENMLRSQQLQEAEKQLSSAEQKLNDALPNYRMAYSGGIDIAKANLDPANITAHHLDLKKVKELKKKIEELKKQQQQAQQDSRSAQQKNRDPRASKQQKQQAASKAEQSAKDLQEKAQKMGQKELEKRAQQAQQSLKKAQQANEKNDSRAAQKHLDDAVKALGADQDSKKDEKKQDNSNKGKQDQKTQDKPLDKPQSSGTPERNDDGRKLDQRSAEQLLDMLKKDEQRRRGEIMKRSRGRQIKVEKDW